MTKSDNAQKKRTTSLVVDKLNRIISVDDECWLEQAKLGNAEEALQLKNVLNNFLSDFIRDDNTTMYIEAVISLCRLRNETIYREYRCDSPTHKRFMELELIPKEYGHIEMVHYLIREEPFDDEVNIIDMATEQDNTETAKSSNKPRKYYLRCSMCNSLMPPDSTEWMEPGELIKHSDGPFRVIHTICDKCSSTLWHRRN